MSRRFHRQRGSASLRRATHAPGFTLVELLVVLAIVALLLSIVAPRYFGSLDRSREVTLEQNLQTLRDVIDKHYADYGTYPNSLDELVQRQYLRTIPRDPITESAQTWLLIPPPDGKLGGVFDVRSGAQGATREGRAFSEL